MISTKYDSIKRYYINAFKYIVVNIFANNELRRGKDDMHLKHSI